MKTQDTSAALERLRAAGVADQPIFCVQNGVANERFALRRFPERPRGHGDDAGDLRHPGEVVRVLDAAPRRLRSRALSRRQRRRRRRAWPRRWRPPTSPPSSRPTVMASKYGKLLLNLSNIVEAALGPEADTQRFVRRSAPRPRPPLPPPASPWRDVGGGDPRRVALMRQAPVEGVERSGGSSTQSLARGTGSIETDWLNGEIVLLGRLHGVPTPAERLPDRARRPSRPRWAAAGRRHPGGDRRRLCRRRGPRLKKPCANVHPVALSASTHQPRARGPRRSSDGATSMQYLLMIYLDEKAAAGIPAEVRDKGTAAYRAYNEALAGAGVLVAGDRLRPTADATTVRRRRRQDAGARRALRRDQGAARRLLPDRRRPTSTPRSPGRRAVPAPPTASSRSARSGR